MDGALAEDVRGLSEVSGVAILIGMTVVVTASVGLHVLIVEEAATGPRDANFTYDYVEANSVLIITHAEGSELPAGDVLINGSGREITWATAAGINESETVSRGDTIQLSSRSAFGTSIGPNDRIRIYLKRDGNRSQISEWTGN